MAYVVVSPTIMQSRQRMRQWQYERQSIGNMTI